MLTPELTVAAVIARDDRFLVVEERVSGRLVLNQPAGHVEAGETLVEAAGRETREETAWAFEPEAIVGQYLWHSPRRDACILRTAFCGSARDHDHRQPLDAGIVAAHWLTLAELEAARERLRSPLVLRSIADYLEGRRYPLSLLTNLDGEVTEAT